MWVDAHTSFEPQGSDPLKTAALLPLLFVGVGLCTLCELRFELERLKAEGSDVAAAFEDSSAFEEDGVAEKSNMSLRSFVGCDFDTVTGALGALPVVNPPKPCDKFDSLSPFVGFGAVSPNTAVVRIAGFASKKVPPAEEGLWVVPLLDIPADETGIVVEVVFGDSGFCGVSEDDAPPKARPPKASSSPPGAFPLSGCVSNNCT